MIYLSKFFSTSTTDTTLVSDIAFPQHAHIIPATFRRAKSGLKYPPHTLLETVVILLKRWLTLKITL